jgi:hypothetical protein
LTEMQTKEYWKKWKTHMSNKLWSFNSSKFSRDRANFGRFFALKNLSSTQVQKLTAYCYVSSKFEKHFKNSSRQQLQQPCLRVQDIVNPNIVSRKTTKYQLFKNNAKFSSILCGFGQTSLNCEKVKKVIGFFSTIKKSYRLRNIDIIGMSSTDNSTIHSDNFVLMTALNTKLCVPSFWWQYEWCIIILFI